jgi:hypothetical protein
MEVIQMIGYPLDSMVTYNEGIPEYDRAVSSAPLRELIKRLFSDGILPDKSTDLRVQYVGSTRVSGDVEGATSTYNVIVHPGFGICNGCLKLQDDYYGLEMNAINTTNPRIDTVVLRLDDNSDVRACTFDIIQGVEAPSPVPPTLTRNSTIWEIGLANIHKPAVIAPANPITVTDTRLDPSRCGIISSISEFDTTALYNQVQDDLRHFKTVNEAEFNVWFENLQTQLSEDVAGNLQGQIGILSQLMTANRVNLVDAINEVFSRNIPSTPTRTITVSSSQSLTTNPIPTSWEQEIIGTKYRSGSYAITASGYASGYEVYKAFDGTVGTSWRTPSATQHTLVLELPEEILIDKVHLQFNIQGTAEISLQSSKNGSSWTTEEDVSASISFDGDVELSNAPRTKYLRILVNASTAVTFTLQSFEIVDYTVTTRNASFVLSNMPVMTNGQTILVYIDPTHDATGIASNTLNGVSVRSILQADRKYELTYYTTYYTVKEVG